jgi:hypothetical protein
MNTMKNGMKKLLMATAVATGCLTGAVAQEFTLGVGAQVQLSTLDVVGPAVSSGIGQGGGGGILVDLGLKFGDHWSIHTGAGYSLFQSATELGGIRGSEDTVDGEGESFTFNYALDGYTERQEFGVVSIPLHLQYEGSGKTRFFVRGGASYNLVTGATQQGRVGRLQTSGFFPRFNGTLTAPAFAGFGTYEGLEFGERDLELDNSINLSLETGVKQLLQNNNSIYVGVFVEHGLNDISSDDPKGAFVSYNAAQPRAFVNNGVFGSNVDGSRPAVEEARLFYAGVRLRYQWGGSSEAAPQVGRDQEEGMDEDMDDQ